MNKYKLELLLEKNLGSAVETEYKFHKTRRWRFDYCVPDQKIAFEYEGGIFVKGRHTRAVGYTNDCDKYNAAAARRMESI